MAVVVYVTEGHAMVASYSRGSVAYINYTSVPVARASSSCLSFWYYMFAGPVGSLAVYVTVDGSVRRRVWERHVSRGGTGISGRWLQGEIEFTTDNVTLTEVPDQSADDLCVFVIVESLPRQGTHTTTVV